MWQRVMWQGGRNEMVRSRFPGLPALETEVTAFITGHSPADPLFELHHMHLTPSLVREQVWAL